MTNAQQPRPAISIRDSDLDCSCAPLMGLPPIFNRGYHTARKSAAISRSRFASRATIALHISESDILVGLASFIQKRRLSVRRSVIQTANSAGSFYQYRLFSSTIVRGIDDCQPRKDPT